MKTPKYEGLRERVKGVYGAAFREHGRSLGALLIPKGRQAERFDAHSSVMKGEGFSVLDFGCGFGDLKSYLDRRFENVRYTGVDMLPDFIAECERTYGAGADFRLIQTFEDITDTFDYVVVCGAFNTLYTETREQHWGVLQEILLHLFSRTKRVLSFDFMTDKVDYQSPGAYHQSPIEGYQFAVSQLSRRTILNQSYLPYEFAIACYKDDTILRPENVYPDV